MCGFVVTVRGGRERFAKEKNGKKRGMCVEGAGRWCGQAAYAVRQVKRMCDRFFPPRFTLCGLVAVSHCFSRHHF